jgi:glyoxylase-like metal-dependent hydrolase (beta-lactamase superfamily II)
VSVEETKAALAAAGIANEVVPIPFNITLLKFGNETVLFDAGTGGQFQPTAGAMIANMAAAGIKPAQITSVVVSHFHPDHVFGLMSKAPDKHTGLSQRHDLRAKHRVQRKPRHPGEIIPEWWAHRAESAFVLPIYPAPAGTAPGIGDGAA